MRELYEQTLVIDGKLQYALFFYQPASFNEVVKDTQWVQEMNEEIDVIEMNHTWDRFDILRDKSRMGFK